MGATKERDSILKTTEQIVSDIKKYGLLLVGIEQDMTSYSALLDLAKLVHPDNFESAVKLATDAYSDL